MNNYQNLIKNWQKVNKYKEEIMQANAFWKLPISNKSSMELAQEIIINNSLSSILDVGANDKKFRSYVPKNCKYFSLDLDTTFKRDYYSLNDIPKEEKFDMMTLFATIEHIKKENFFNRFVLFLYHHLSEKEFIVISSDNISHNLGIRTDYSHVTYYSPRDLHAIMKNFGFNTIKIYRIGRMNHLVCWFYSIISKTILRPFCLDFCPEICWIFSKCR